MRLIRALVASRRRCCSRRRPARAQSSDRDGTRPGDRTAARDHDRSAAGTGPGGYTGGGLGSSSFYMGTSTPASGSTATEPARRRARPSARPPVDHPRAPSTATSESPHRRERRPRRRSVSADADRDAPALDRLSRSVRLGRAPRRRPRPRPASVPAPRARRLGARRVTLFRRHRRDALDALHPPDASAPTGRRRRSGQHGWNRARRDAFSIPYLVD